MYSIIYFATFVSTLWLGLYLLVRMSSDHRVWPVISALLSAAAAQLCALMASTASVESVAMLWRRGVLLVGPVFLVSYVAIGLVLSPKDESSPVRKVATFSSYGISLALAAVAIRAGLGGLVDQHIGFVYLASEATVIVLTLLCILVPCDRKSYPYNKLPPASIAAMSVLGFIGVIPLVQSLPSELAGLLVRVLLLCAMVALVYGVLRYRSLLRQWNEQSLHQRRSAMGLLTNALVLTLYAAVASTLMWWLTRTRVSDSPLLLSIALSSLGIAVFEVVRLRISRAYLRMLSSTGDLDYYQMSRTIHRALLGQDLARMMQAVLDPLCQRLNVSKGFIAVGDDRGGFKIRAVHGMTSTRIGDSIELPTTTGQASIDEEIALLIPLKIQSRQYGVLALGSRTVGDFNDAEVQLLTALAYQLATAVENLHLKRQIAEQLESLVATSDDVLHRQVLLRESLRSVLIGLGDAHRHSPKQVRVRCLGRLEVYVEQRLIESRMWGGRSSGHRHARAIFAYLVANRERLVRRDELIEVIWGDSGDARVLENRLDRTVSALRRTLEPRLRKGAESSYISTRVDGYTLNPAIEWWIDAEEFSRLVQEARVLERTGDEGSALHKHQQAERLYQGDYMIACDFVDRSHLITARREGLRQKYIDTLTCIAGLHQHNGSCETGIQYLQKAALEDQFNEEVYQALIRSYCAAHRYAEAILACRTHSSELEQAGLACSGICFPPEVQEVLLTEHISVTGLGRGEDIRGIAKVKSESARE